MARIHLIRHAEPAATWGEADDPGLSSLGAGQARAAAHRLAALSPVEIWTSPLRRCRETAAPFEAVRGQAARVRAEVAEIPTPAAVGDRRVWLAHVLSGDWGQARAPEDWRRGVLAALEDVAVDTAIFSHFVAINVAVGAALGTTAVTAFRPGHCSITTLETSDEGLRLIALGDEAAGPVL